MQDRIFYAICFGFVFGVLLRSLILLNFYFVLFLLLISLVSVLYFSVIKYQWGIILGIFILVFTLGIFRFHLADVLPPDFLESQVGENVALSGVVVDEPEIKENYQRLTVMVEEELETKILVNVNFGEDFKYGDIIKFSGKLEKPENFVTDQGKVFDYMNYLRKDGIFYIMNYADVEVVSQRNGNFVKRSLFAVKEKFLEKMNLVIASPENLLMGGLILGEKSSFSEELRQNFVNTGTIHIVALSGYNVTIVAEWFMKLFGFLPKNFGFGMGIFTILLFVLMTGGSSTAVRAGIMAVLVLIARATGRNYDVARALMLAGVFMILLNPFVLVYDVSFQLSFIATVAVIFFTPKIEKYFMWVTKSFKLRDVVAVTFAAYTFVLPFILYKMGNLSLVALPANVLILPFIPLTMFFGFLTSFVGIFWHALSVPLGFISFLLLHYELSVINFLSRIPFSSITIPDFSFAIALLIYIYFIYKLFWRSIRSFFVENI